MRKLTRRSYNRKLIVFGLAIFLAFGMISTGFAAWLISSAAEKEANSPVEVDKIVDESFELIIDQLDAEGKWKADADKISFDAKKDDTTGRVQFQENGTGDAGEQLELLLSGTVTNIGALGMQPETDTRSIKIDIALPDTLWDAITAKYLTASYVVGDPETGTPVAITAATTTVWVAPTATADGEGTFSVTLKFGWGEEFNFKNPCEYYDQITDSNAEGYIPDAQMKTELAAFRGMLVEATEGEDALAKEYSGTIAFTVTAAASY